MPQEKQTYVAQYLALNRVGKWSGPGQTSPRFRFKARSDDEALDIALSFAKKPTMYFEGAKRRGPIPEARYQLTHLFRLDEIELTREKPSKMLKVCLGKDDFGFF